MQKKTVSNGVGSGERADHLRRPLYPINLFRNICLTNSLTWCRLQTLSYKET